MVQNRDMRLVMILLFLSGNGCSSPEKLIENEIVPPDGGSEDAPSAPPDAWHLVECLRDAESPTIIGNEWSWPWIAQFSIDPGVMVEGRTCGLTYYGDFQPWLFGEINECFPSFVKYSNNKAQITCGLTVATINDEGVPVSHSGYVWARPQFRILLCQPNSNCEQNK